MKKSITQLADDLRDGIRDCPIIYISHYDESLIDRAIEIALKKLREDTSIVSEWQCGRGEVVFQNKKPVDRDDDDNVYKTLSKYLTAIADDNFVSPKGREKKVFVIKDPEFESKEHDIIFSLLQLFALRYFTLEHRTDNRCIILIDTSCKGVIPSKISKIVTTVNVLPPTFDEIKSIIQEAPQSENNKLSERNLNELCRNLQGLDEYEIRQILRSISHFQNNVITSDCIPAALEEKKRLVKKMGVIDIIDANERFEQIGGLKQLRSDLQPKKKIFSKINKVREDKIPIPKGILIIGMPGCGKSMIAKAIANEFGVSLLRLDMNRVLGSYVGESEQNMKKVLLASEAASPCVLWIDEIEKAFSGASGADDTKNDTVLRMMGMFLTWMQEHDSPVYIVATANDIMRAEFMRKGRFDEIYFVDFPTDKEIEAILQKKIKECAEYYSNSIVFDVNDLEINLARLAKAASGFTGAEIQSAVNTLIESAYVKYLDSLNLIDEQPNKRATIPLSATDLEDIINNMASNITKLQAQDHNSTVAKLEKYRGIFKSASGVKKS